MTPPFSDTARSKALQNAIALFESNPDFPGVLVEIDDRTRAIKSQISAEETRLGTEPRMHHLLKILDVVGEAYLRLVIDMATQKAFTVILQEAMRLTWHDYCGYPIEILQPNQGQIAPIEGRVRHWTVEGYRRLDLMRREAQQPKSLHPSTLVALPDTVAEKRRSFILPILEERGISRSKWAALAGVDPSVVYDYLSGESDPRPDTRKVLAEAIELTPSDLPR